MVYKFLLQLCKPKLQNEMFAIFIFWVTVFSLSVSLSLSLSALWGFVINFYFRFRFLFGFAYIIYFSSSQQKVTKYLESVPPFFLYF